MESKLDRISFLGVDCLFSQQSQAKVKSPGPSEHFQNKWGQAYAVGIIGPLDSMHLPKLSGGESPLSSDVPLGLESKSMTQEVLITRRLRFEAQFL